MKLLTLFVFFLSSLAFSAEIDFSYIKKVMGEKNYQINKTIKSKSIRAHVCKEIEKDKEQRRKHSRSKDKSKRKHHRKHNFLKKLKRVSHFNKFGKKFINRDLTISEVENELPNLLTVEIDSKDIKGRKREKYTPVEIYYKVFNPEDSIIDRFKAPFETGTLYEKDGKKRFDIDLSSLTLGEHDLFVKIVSYKTVHYGKKSKRKRKYVHFANLRFEKINLDSAHLVANVFGQTDTNSRIGFDLSNSYSDVGTLTLFNIKGYKNNELILNEDVLPENLTQLWFFFSENGQYHFEFTVTDSLGDTDTFISETYTPTLLSPTLNYTYSQDSEEKSVLHFDFSESIAPEGTNIRNYGVFIYQNDELVEEHISPIPKFSFAIEARGDMRLDVSIDTHQDQYSIESIQSFNLPADVPKVSTINLSHLYDFRPDNPFKFGYAFRNDFNFDSVSKVNYKIVSKTDTLQGEAEFYNLDGVEFHIYVEYPKVGNYNVEFQIETNDGSRFYPYRFDQNVDVDLGSANLAMSLNLINNGHSLNWTIDDSSSSAGNFGYFTGFTCKGVNQSTSETFDENSTDLIHEFPIARGTWNIDCFGTTNFGLISNTLNFEIESLNQIPSASFNILAGIPNKKDITISTTQSDSDGEVTLGELNIQAPSGEIQNVNVIGEINLTLGEVGLHYFSFRVQDNEGAWSETSYQTYEVINDVPVANLQILALENRTFELIKDAQDSDGSVSEFYLTLTSPQGVESSYTGFETLTVRLSEVGKWSISYYCVDNDGAQSIVNESEVSVTNIIPVASLEVSSREHEGSKRVLFKFNSTDTDGDIDTAIVSVITPNGDRSDYEWGHSGEIEFDFWTLGTHTIEFKVQDNDNTWSEVVSTTYEVINSAPIANLEVIPTDSPKDVIFRYSSSDSDGYIIEVLTIINTPSGESHEYTFGFEEDISFSFWEEGNHTISYLVKDDWGVWSEPSVVQYEAVSPYSPPLAEIIIDPNTGSDRTINVTLRHQSTSGEVVQGELIRITPNGVWDKFEYLEGVYQISIDEVGTHEFRYAVSDDQGNWSEVALATYTFESDIPYPDYELTPTGNPGEYQFTPTYSDPNNLISYPELAIFDPEGNWMGFRGDEARILNFDKIGEWRIVLSFFTHDGMRSDSNIKHVQVDEIQTNPIALFEITPQNGEVPLTVNLNASASYGVEKSLVDYSWEISDGTSLNGIEVSHTFTQEGTFQISLSVRDSEGLTAVTTKSLVVRPSVNEKPVPVINISETRGEFPLSVTFDGTNSYDPENEELNYKWTFIDGEVINGPTVTKTFTEEGSFLVSLEVFDFSGQSAVVEQSFYVAEENKKLKITHSGYIGLNGGYHGEVSFGLDNLFMDGELQSISWKMGDGSIKDIVSFSHYFEEVGEYQVSVLVEDNLGNTKEATTFIQIDDLKNPNDVQSQFKVNISGIDVDSFNPIQNTVTVSIEGEGIFNSEIGVSLNEVDITDSFVLSEDKKQLSGMINSLDGVNSLEVHGFDQFDNKVDSSIGFISGENTISFVIKDSSAQSIGDFPLSIKNEFGDSFEINISTDGNGAAQFSNIPNMNISLMGVDARGFISKFMNINDSGEYELEIREQGVVSEVDNSKFDQGVEAWETDSAILNIISVDNVDSLKIETTTGDNSNVSHTYEYRGESKFLVQNFDVSYIDSEHTMVFTVVNHTKHEIKTLKAKEGEFSKDDLAIYVEDGDVVSYNIKTELSSTDQTVFLDLYKKVTNGFSSYASTGSLVVIFPINEKYTVLEEVYLTDLNNAKQSPEGDTNYNLTPLRYLSIGNYPQGHNNVYISFKLLSVLPGNIKMTDLKLSQKDSDFSGLVEIKNSALINGFAINKKSSSGQLYELNYFSRLDGKKDIDSGNGLSNFVPFFEITSNDQLSSSEDINISFSYNATLTDGNNNLYPEFGSAFFTVSKDNLLVDHGIHGNRHYNYDETYSDGTPIIGRNNIGFPDNGDTWVKPYMVPVLKNFVQNTILDIGDATNVNGVDRDKGKASFFQPHGDHSNGEKLDFISVNFNKNNKGFDEGAIEDLNNLNSQIREKISKIYVTKFDTTKDPKFKKLYQNSCVSGIKLLELVGEWGDHDDHYHMEFTDSPEKSAFHGVTPISNNPIIKDKIIEHPTDFGKYAVEFSFDNLVLDGYMIQLFEKDKSGKVNELIRKYKDEFYKGNGYQGIPGLKFYSENATSPLKIVMSEKLDLEALDDRYYMRISQVSNEGCNTNKYYLSSLFRLKYSPLSVKQDLVLKKKTGVDISINVSKQFDSLKLKRMVRKGGLEFSDRDDPLPVIEFESAEELKELLGDDLQLDGEKLNFNYFLEFNEGDEEGMANVDNSYVQIEVCLFNSCKLTGVKNYSRFRHKKNPSDFGMNVVIDYYRDEPLSPFEYQMFSSYELEYVVGHSPTDNFGTYLCRANNLEITRVNHVGNFSIAKGFNASQKYYSDGIWRFDFSDDCNEFPEGYYEGVYRTGYDGRITGNLLIKISDHPKLDSSVERNIKYEYNSIYSDGTEIDFTINRSEF